MENGDGAAVRIPLLLAPPAAVRFLSCEPLLGSLALTHCDYPSPGRGFVLASSFDGPVYINALRGYDYNGVPTRIDWVIAGGESAGPAKRALVEPCIGCSPRTRGECIEGLYDAKGMCTGFEPKPEALEWVRSLRDQCVAAGGPFFF